MLKKTVLSSILAAATVFAGAAHAGYTEYAQGNYPATIQAVEKSGLIVNQQFEAIGGLHGWVLRDRNTGNYTLVYTTENGEAVLAGMAIDANGQNMTAVYAQKYLPKTEPKAEAPRGEASGAHTAAYKAFVNEATSVVVGTNKNAPEVTVLFDPNCGYCKVMHKILAPSIAAGELRVRYVPVAILGGDSPQKAAALLAAKKPQTALEEDLAGTLVGSNDAALLSKVTANTMLMRKYGFQGTPVVMYKDRSNKDKTQETLMVSEGVPTLSTMFNSLGVSGQLDKLKADPQLVRFIR